LLPDESSLDSVVEFVVVERPTFFTSMMSRVGTYGLRLLAGS
jgi:hypothetical protein